ncbi:PP-loop family-domain-containing protein [Russula aff. rugulosa BPL654]|nr:PP-loop family-domain-containing protein [Russula aff. rugulosa BPL654]
MAYAAGTAATRFKAVHSELRVPWGEPPFPPHPTQKAGDTADADADADADAGAGASEATTIESVARTARYQLLFDEMLQRRAYVLATGHHADDQVETVLMRLGSGSTLLGLGGMRPVRRFGMAIGKNDSDFGWFGHEGLERWIVRPLLDVPKDRILATCHLHKIRYVVDRTNFQPDLTLRNAIRHMIANNEKKRDPAVPVPVEPRPLPPVMAHKIMQIKSASEDLKIPIPIDWMASRENLRAAVHASSRNLSDIEGRVSAYLSRFSVQSPPGTFILAADRLSTMPMDQLVQHTIVLRILRYISPLPWGSTRAQAGRRRESLQRIVQHVWDPDPASKKRTRLEAGASVLWTPLRICIDGRLKYEQPRVGERFGWLVSRAPPPRPSKQEFDRDISTELLSPAGRRRAEILYDNRFLITFRLEAVPPDDPVMASVVEGSGRVMLVLGGRWLWPQVVWRRKDEDDVVVAHISAAELDWYEPPPGMRRTYTTRPPSEVPKEPPCGKTLLISSLYVF